MNQIWSPIEEQFIRDNADIVTDEVGAAQLSAIVGRPISIYAWRKKRQKMGLHKAPGRGVCKVLQQHQPMAMRRVV